MTEGYIRRLIFTMICCQFNLLQPAYADTVAETIECPSTTVKHNSFLVCNIIRRPRSTITLTLVSEPKRIRKCRVETDTPTRIPEQVMFLMEDQEKSAMLTISDEDSKDSETKEIRVEGENRIITRSDDQFTTFKVDSKEEVSFTWEFTRYLKDMTKDKECYFRSLIGKIDVSAVSSHYTAMPLEMVLNGASVLVPNFGLPFGSVFVTAMHGNRSITHLLQKAVDQRYVVNFQVRPFASKLPWPINQDLVIDLTHTYSPYLTPESGFIGDPSDVLWTEVKCVTDDSIQVSRREKIYTVKAHAMPRKNLLSRFRFIISMGIVGKNRRALNSAFSHSFIVMLRDEHWPPVSLRCIKHCVQHTGYFVSTRTFRLYCPLCQETGNYVDIHNPCLGEDHCGKQPPYYKMSILNYQDAVNVMGGQVHTMATFNFPNQVRQPIKDANIMIHAPCTVVEPLLKCSFKVIPEGKYEFHPSKIYHFMATWKLGGKTVTIPWLTTLQWTVGHVVTNLCLDNKLILPAPDIRCVHVDGMEIMGDAQVNLSEATPTEQADKNATTMRKLISTLDENSIPSGPDGVRYTWLLVRAAAEYKTTADNSLTNDIFKRFARTMLESAVTYNDIDLVLDILKTTFMDMDVIFSREMQESIPVFVNRVFDTLTAVIKDTPFSHQDKQCSMVETLVLMYSRITQNIALGNAFYEHLGSKIMALGSLMVRTVDTYQECQGKYWQMKMHRMTIQLRSNYSDARIYSFDLGNMMTVKMNRNALYQKVMDDRDEVVETEIYNLMFHLHTSVLLKYWVGQQYKLLLTSGTTLIEQYRRYDRAIVHPSREPDSMELVYNIDAITKMETFGNHKNGRGAKGIILKFDYMIQNGKIVSDCNWIMIKPDHSSHRSLTLEFVEKDDVEITFLLRSALADQGRDVVNFDEVATTQVVKGKKVMVNIEPVPKSYMFKNPRSSHVLLVKLESISGKEDGVYQISLNFHLISIYCSYLSNPSSIWELGMCLPKNVKTGSITCSCNRLSGMYSLDTLDVTDQLSHLLIHSKLIKVLKPTEKRNKQYVVVYSMLTVWMAFFFFAVVFRRADSRNEGMYRTSLATFHFSPHDRYRYMVCLKTSAVPNSGTVSKAWLSLIGNLRCSGEMLLDSGFHFKTRSEMWFMVSTGLNLGTLQGVTIRIDSGAIQDHWRLKYLDVYDVTRDALIRMFCKRPLTTLKASQTISSIMEYMEHPTYNMRLMHNFGVFVVNHHVILSALLIVPGAQKQMKSLLRLMCLILWSFIVIIIFVIGVPKYQFDDEDLKTSANYALMYTPVLAVIDKFNHGLLSKLFESNQWKLTLSQPSETQEPRVVCPRTHYSNDQVLIATRRRPDLPKGTIGLAETVEKPIRHNTLESSSVDVWSRPTQRRSHEQTDLRAFRQHFYDETLIRATKAEEFRRRTLETEGGKLLPNTVGHHFLACPIHTVIAQDIRHKDPVFFGYEITGKGIYSHSTVTTRKPRHDNFKVKNWQTAETEVPSKNVIGGLTTSFLLIATAFICILSLHQREEENTYTVLYAFMMTLADIFLLEPISLMIFSLFASLGYLADNALFWARRRTADANNAINRWYELQGNNYMGRFRYQPSFEYKSLGNLWYQRLMVHVQKIKMVDFELGIVSGGRIRYLLLIGCAITIINYHSDVYSSFLLKESIYKDLNINQSLEYTAGRVDDLWEHLLKNHIPYVAKGGKTTMKFSRIRQVRVMHHEPCPEDRSRFIDIATEHCRVPIREENEETRDFCRDWNTTLKDSTPKPSKPKERCSDLFLFIKPNETIIDSLGTEYPLGGYEYVLATTGTQDNIYAIQQMKRLNWVDEKTRAVLVESTILDLNTGDAATFTTAYRFQLNGIRVTHMCDPFVFTFDERSLKILATALGIWGILTLAETSMVLSKIRTVGIKPFVGNIDNIVHLINLIFYILLLVGFAVRLSLTRVKYEVIREAFFGTDGKLYLSLRDIAFVINTLNSTSGCLAFNALFILFENARHIPKFRIMMDMIKHVFVLALAPVLATVWLSLLLFFVFKDDAYQMSTLMNCIYSVTEFIVRQTKLKVGSNPMKQPATLMLWVVFFFIITNGFLVSLNEDYSVLVMEDKANKAKKNRHKKFRNKGKDANEIDPNKQQYRQDEKLLIFSSRAQ